MLVGSFLLAGLILGASPQAKEPPRRPPASGSGESEVAIVGGLGSAYGALGVDFDFELSHFEPFFGLGIMLRFGGAVAGVRFFPAANERGFYVVLSGGGLIGDGEDIPHVLLGGLCMGYRADLSKTVFVQFGLGVIIDAADYRNEPWSVGAVPDLDLGIGSSF